jgi:hypothetical protein
MHLTPNQHEYDYLLGRVTERFLPTDSVAE